MEAITYAFIIITVVAQNIFTLSVINHHAGADSGLRAGFLKRCLGNLLDLIFGCYGCDHDHGNHDRPGNIPADPICAIDIMFKEIQFDSMTHMARDCFILDLTLCKHGHCNGDRDFSIAFDCKKAAMERFLN